MNLQLVNLQLCIERQSFDLSWEFCSCKSLPKVKIPKGAYCAHQQTITNCTSAKCRNKVKRGKFTVHRRDVTSQSPNLTRTFLHPVITGTQSHVRQPNAPKERKKIVLEDSPFFQKGASNARPWHEQHSVRALFVSDRILFFQLIPTEGTQVSLHLVSHCRGTVVVHRVPANAA